MSGQAVDGGRGAGAGHLPGLAWGVLAAAVAALLIAGGALPDGLVRPPGWLVQPLETWINVGFTFVREDLGLTVLTRAIADVVAEILDIINNILTGARGGLGLPAMPWPMLAVSGFVVGAWLGGWRLSLLTGGTLVYLAVFGQWKWAMETLALVLTAAPLAVALGLGLGILAYRRRWLEALIIPLLNVVQSMPHFAYLIPVVVFFGVGDHAGAIATVIFATPPMIRMSLLGMKRVPVEVVEAGKMCGSTRWQILRHVQVPTARSDILVGVNQVIMQCLAMVVIASFIGTPGLGYRLLNMLQGLKIGKALELGISIVLIALVLDRCTKAWAHRVPAHLERDEPFRQRYRLGLVWVGLIALCFAVLPLHDWFSEIPRRQALTTSPFWDAIVDWLTLNLFDTTLALRTFLSLNVLVPMRDAFLYAPFSAVLLAAAGAGWLVGGIRSAALCAGFILFIAVSGWWDRAMITAYMVTYAALICIVIGIPIGIWASRTEARSRVVLILCDTFQTFPSFIYLIPVIMLFQVNDVAAIGAVIIYAMIPIVRYTIEGLRAVPQHLREAVAMSGAGPMQSLVSLELPMALPHMMVGVNQTVMFGLFMVIIAAFIGTQDLGQQMMRALSSNDVGQGLVLGLCVACLGLLIDRLVSDWARARKAALGLE